MLALLLPRVRLLSFHITNAVTLFEAHTYLHIIICRLHGEEREVFQRIANLDERTSLSRTNDRDALVIEVLKDGPACHLGTDSCFEYPLFKDEEKVPFSYEGLMDMIKGRRENPKEGSYTTYLFEKGLDKILKKVGEESTEVIISAKDNDKDNTVYEIGDLMYHVMVLMCQMNITVDDIQKEMASRHVIDTKVKQEKMIK